jgi:hypothetical protein
VTEEIFDPNFSFEPGEGFFIVVCGVGTFDAKVEAEA